LALSGAGVAIAAEEDIPALIKQLDADAFNEREAASAALQKIGEPARAALEEVVAKSPSAEAKSRAARLLKELEVERIRKSAFKLEELLGELKGAEDEKWDRSKLAMRLDTLMLKLSDATGRKCQLPVNLKDLPRGAGERVGPERGGQLIIAKNGHVSFAENSVVLFTGSGSISHAQNSVIIARYAVDIAHVTNCVVISGMHLEISHVDSGSLREEKPAEGKSSIVLTGGTASISHATHAILGFGGGIQHGGFINGESFLINTKLPGGAERREIALPAGFARTKIQQITSDSIDLTPGKPDNTIADKMTITSIFNESGRGTVLYRRPGGDGEYVVRLNEEPKFPSGEKMPELAGWKLVFVSDTKAIFENGDKVSVLDCVRGR
jgi:hypothetical protein